jgi:hypothetical protein
MHEYFKWSKVYNVAHEQGGYFIFTAEFGQDAFAGVLLPACVDDIWNMAGSRLIQTINIKEEVASSHDEVIQRINSWMSINLNGEFKIELNEGMAPPPETEFA